MACCNHVWFGSSAQRHPVETSCPNGFGWDTHECGESLVGPIASVQLSAPLKILQIFGFYPRAKIQVGESNTTTRCSVLSVLLVVVTTVFLLVNLATFTYMLWLFDQLRMVYGFINVMTVCCIINGLKPLHDIINLMVFGYRCKRHVKMLIQLDRIDSHFRSQLGFEINLRIISFTFVMATLAILLISFAISGGDFYYRGQYGWMDFAALLLSPCLCLWQLVPLMYFGLITRVVRLWLNQLCLRIKSDIQQSRRSLPLYCETFAMLTRAIQLVGKLFNPFILMSLTISCTVFCFAINFVINASSIFTFIGPYQAYFIVAWGLLQTIIAGLYIFIICIAGFKTNEKVWIIS